jgi:hypothetical protein
VRTKGGWAPINVLPTPEWELGGGMGMDDPDDADLATDVFSGGSDPYGGGTEYEFGSGTAIENFSWEPHLIWRPHPLVFGLEFKRIETTYGDPDVGKRTANHVNMALGFVF